MQRPTQCESGASAKRASRAALASALLLLVLARASEPAAADETRIRMMLVTPDGVGPTIGTMRAGDGGDGLRLAPLFKDLAPGAHAAAIHANGDCGPAEKDGRKIAAGAAGDPFQPTKADLSGPAADKPPPVLRPFVLAVGADGIARTVVTVPQAKLAMIRGRSIVVEEGPAGGAAVACGVIPAS